MNLDDIVTVEEGLKEMLNGVTHMVRNVTAHELKVKWVVNEQDAIDILTTISFYTSDWMSALWSHNI